MGIRRSNLGRGDIARDANWLRPFLPAVGGDTYRVRVSVDDTTPDYLDAKIISTDASVVITVLNDGADEDLDLSVAVYVAAEIATHASDADAHHALVTLSTTANNNLLSLSGQEIGLDNQSANVVFAGPSTGGAAAPSFRALVDADIPASIARDTELHDAVTLAADAGAILGLTGQQITLDSQSANTLFAGPTSGGAADPTFRALVDADIPASIARDSEVTAAVFVHTADADAHHNWPLLDADIPSTIARDSEVTAAISSHASDANAHHNRSHAITSSSDHTVTGAALDVVGLTSTNTLGVLTPSSAPGAASALLKSDSSGYLTLVRYIANGAAGTARVFQWQTGGSARWDLRANSTAESGSNAGSDLQLFAYSDAGAFLSTAMQVTRATGYVNFPGTAVQATALGVGVSPSVPIHVSSTSNEMIRLSHSSSGSPFIAFYTDSLRHGYLQANTNNTVYLAAEYGSLVFQTGTAGTASTRVTIEDDGDVVMTAGLTVGGDLTITTTGDQGDRFIMENSSVSGSSVFYDFNDTDRDAGSTGAFELGFYRDANNITQVRMSKEVFEVIIRSGGTYRFPLEVRAQQVILAELPTSNPGIIGALYRSGNDVLIST
ncbi:MAG: hypothetical protein IT327_07825 [Anaerolineae bacterium]|nr:hypothetical protein [Anaerolineae bacterium]